MKTITTDFEYLPAATVEEALDLLAQHKDDDYKVIAGGQSLCTAMKHRLIAPEFIIDIKGLSDLELHHVRRKGWPENRRTGDAPVS
jgi:CO/xanthine dehydrogenase FAD-binding subunit